MNQGYIYRDRIGPRHHGQTALDYLSERYTHSDRDIWRGHIQHERVRVNGRVVSESHILSERDVVAWHRPAWEEPTAPLHFDILYDRHDIVVVSKRSGLPTMAGGGFLEHTLTHQLQIRYPGVSPVHRLGRWTSGAVICARSRAARAAMTAQLTERTIHKRYRALAAGSPDSTQFTVDSPIGPIPYPPLGRLHAHSLSGRPAVSHVTVLEQGATSCLCDVVIDTGRPHQIRIHLAAAGHPLVGDPLYGIEGVPEAGCTALPGDPGYTLHAAEVGFRDPETGERVTVLAPLPASLRRSD